MYFICENKQVIKPEVQRTNAYQHKKHADEILAQMDKSVKNWRVGKPPITYSVEGFYLVHES
jgi:hypothetical protein